MVRFIAAALWIVFCVFAGPASAWVEDVVAETEAEANKARCVGLTPLNDMVHILNAPSDRSIMSETEERTAVIDMTKGLGSSGRFRVTRGGALSYEAVTRANTAEGRQDLTETLRRLSDAAITIFFVPYLRENGFVRTEVTLLIRRAENGKPVLACTPTFRVDIPISMPGQKAGRTQAATLDPDPHGDVVAFVKAFHNMANRQGSCIDMGQFYAPHVVVEGQTRTRSEQVRLRCEIERLNPEIVLRDGTIAVTDLGGGRYRVSYSNTSKIDDQGRRVTTDWYVDAVIENLDGRLQYTRIDLTSRRR